MTTNHFELNIHKTESHLKPVLLCFFSCAISVSLSLGQSLDELNWMLGDWEMVDGSSTTTEFWQVKDDSTFIGKGVSLKDGKVVFEEQLSIELRNNQITYVAVLPHKTARFLLTEHSDQTAVFEDSKNDFPSEIQYKQVSNRLDVTLFGKQNDEDRSMKLEFIRKQN